MAVLPFDSAKFNNATAKTRQLIAGFTPGQKAVTTIAAIGLVVGAALFITHASGPNYTVLYSNLQSSQAGQVTQKLTADHVPYQLADGGSTVMVPSANVNQERISLAEAGLPSGGTISFQTLASTGITSSQFVQNVDYQQALEGQLASVIESIQGINSAQVSLVLPDTNSFAVTSSGTSTASVLVSLASGTTLTSNQVQGIVHLVASAVPNLDANNVTVVDSNGNVLTAPGVDASADTDNAQTTAYDNQLSATLGALVARVVGQNNATVQVHALLNFNQQTTTTNGLQVGKNGQPLTASTSQNTTRQNFTGNGAQAAGVLGSGQPSTPTNQNGTYTSTQTQTQSAVGQVTQTVQQAPGQVERTDVAVLVNSSAVKKAQLGVIRSLVVAAAGLNLAAGDSIVVSSLPFSRAALPAKPQPESMLSKLEADAPQAAVALLIVTLFALALRHARRRQTVFEEIPMPLLAAVPMSAEVESSQEVPLSAPEVIGRLSPARSPVTSEVDTYINSSPEEVARLMRVWSQERGRAGS